MPGAGGGIRPSRLGAGRSGAGCRSAAPMPKTAAPALRPWGP